MARQQFRSGRLLAVLAGGLLIAGQAGALDVNLTDERESIQVANGNKLIEVRRDQNPDSLVEPMWAKTSRKCPPFCIQPSVPVPGVKLMTELDLFNFMEQMVNTQYGVIIDARLPDWHLRGTIPGSVNIPFTVFQREQDDPQLAKALGLLGVKPKGEENSIKRLISGVFGEQKGSRWDFSDAKEIAIWCNGPWCGQSPHAIRALTKMGYPAEKIHYYRGGMQMWQILGLTTVVPEPDSLLFSDVGGGE